MNADSKMLNYIHQNVQMGQNSINHLLEIIKDEGEFKNMLRSQLKEYKEIFNQTEIELKTLDGEVKDVNSFQKIEAYLMINIKTLKNKTPDNISEMLIQGSVIGIVQIIRNMKKYKNETSEIVYSIAQKLLDTEQRNFDECKKFIGQQI